jgi:hypothetical protein
MEQMEEMGFKLFLLRAGLFPSIVSIYKIVDLKGEMAAQMAAVASAEVVDYTYTMELV